MIPESRRLRAALICTIFSLIGVAYFDLTPAEIAVILGPIAAYIGSQSLADAGAGTPTRVIVKKLAAGEPNPCSGDRVRLVWAIAASICAAIAIVGDLGVEQVQAILSWIELHILGQGLSDAGMHRKNGLSATLPLSVTPNSSFSVSGTGNPPECPSVNIS